MEDFSTLSSQHLGVFPHIRESIFIRVEVLPCFRCMHSVSGLHVGEFHCAAKIFVFGEVSIILLITFECDSISSFVEVERVAFLQNRAGSEYLKNSRTGSGRAGYTRSVEKLDNDQCSKQSIPFSWYCRLKWCVIFKVWLIVVRLLGVGLSLDWDSPLSQNRFEPTVYT